MREIYLMSISVILMTMSCHAQDSTRVTTLHEVVVSASRMEQSVVETPRSVSVISEQTIRSSVYQSVGELLSAQSGLFISGAMQTPGTNQNIFMRGANSNQVAVLVDGVRITDPSSPNAAIDFSEISLTNVERIEVIRGSHSTLYGGAAVGGVINIITKKGAPEGVHGNSSWQGGSFGKNAWSSAGNLDLTVGIKGGFYAGGSIFRQDIGGLNSAEGSATSFTSDRDNFRKTDALVKAGFANEKWDANVSYKRAHQYTEIDDGAFVDDDNSYLVFDRNQFQYSVTHKFNSSLDLSVIGSFSNSERFFEDDSSQVSATEWDRVYTSGSYYGRLQTHELQLTYDGASFDGIAGAGLYREKMFFDSYLFFNDPSFPFESVTNYDSLDTRTTTAYLFAKGVFHWKRFDFSAGARLSQHTEAGTFATFDLNPSYSFNNFLLYGSVSTAFNPPSLYQLFDPVKSFGSYATRGNEALDPERSLSVELGIKKQFPSGSYLTLAAYQTTVANSIEYVYLWNGDKAVADLDFSDHRGDRYINVGKQEARGVEFEGMLQLTNELSLLGNISVLETEVRATPPDVDVAHTGGHHVQLYNLGRFLDRGFEGNDVVRRPAFTAFSKLSWHPISTLKIDAVYRFTGDRFDAAYDETLGPYGALALYEIDAYHLVDVSVNWRTTSLLTLGLKVENILNENYREVIGFHTRGRGFYLKAAVRF